MPEKYYQLEAPKCDFFKLIKTVDFNRLPNPEVTEVLLKANKRYLHWKELKYKDWIPKDFFPDKESFWMYLKFYRSMSSRLTPIRDEKDNYFRMTIDHYSDFLHQLDIDKNTPEKFVGITEVSENYEHQLIARNTIEESIASAQIEGANTSRQVAKKMLLENKKPRSIDEQMIVNTHITMQKIEQEFYKEKLTIELIYEMHRLITYQTLPEEQQGKLRETLDNNGNRLLIPWNTTTVAYYAPSKEFVETELPRLIAFANDEHEAEFIHPLIKAILLHFWIGLLHPFEDGNGRLARSLFYWYVLKHNYWAFAYLALSEKINISRKQYAKAYIYSEQDDNDVTYFIHYNIEKLKLARTDLQNYVEEQIKKQQLVSQGVDKNDLNDRQMQLLQYLKENKYHYTNLKMHKNLFAISKASAANDLRELIKKGLLEKRRRGRNINYYPTHKINTPSL